MFIAMMTTMTENSSDTWIRPTTGKHSLMTVRGGWCSPAWTSGLMMVDLNMVTLVGVCAGILALFLALYIEIRNRLKENGYSS